MKLKIEVDIADFDPFLMEEIREALDDLRFYGKVKLVKLEDLPSEITLEES